MVNGAIGRLVLRAGHFLGLGLTLCDYLLYFACPVGEQTAELEGSMCRAQGCLTSRPSAKAGPLRVGIPGSGLLLIPLPVGSLLGAADRP